jgi:hypothetical protein
MFFEQVCGIFSLGIRIQMNGDSQLCFALEKNGSLPDLQCCGSGSGIRCLLTPGSRMGKNQDPDPGRTT